MSARIIRADQVARHRAAEAVLDEAQAEAARLLQAARETGAQERDALLCAARQAADAETSRVLAEASAAAQALLAALHNDVAEALARAVARVLGEMDVSDAVARATAQALSEVSARHGVTVHVHPVALARTRNMLAGAPDNIRVVADEALATDGCVLETEAGIVRAGLSDQLSILRAAFLNAAENSASPTMTMAALHV